MQESLSSEHSSELFRDTLEQFLDGGGVTNEGGSHLQTTWRNVAYSNLNIVGNPFNEVGGVLVLDVQHLLINFLHGHAATEDGGDSQVSAMTRVASGHHVLSVKHLLSKFWDSECTILLATASSEWSESRLEKVETGEGYHVDS